MFLVFRGVHLLQDVFLEGFLLRVHRSGEKKSLATAVHFHNLTAARQRARKEKSKSLVSVHILSMQMRDDDWSLTGCLEGGTR